MTAEVFRVRTDGALELDVRAVPGASRTEIAGRHGDALKIRVSAPPERGRANEMIIDVVAAALGVRTSTIELVGGAQSRTKRLKITGIDADELRARLAILLAS
jgi:uncharacterized protein (TIGR00251 family)